MKSFRFVVTFAVIFALASASIPNVMIFYETLCPDCMNEMKKDIPAVLNKFGGDVFLSLVPYGNAEMKISANGKISIECQHGHDECVANAWHACTHIHMTPQERVHYAMCTMSTDRVIHSLKTCTTPRLAAVLEHCAKGSSGLGLMKLMADITDLAGIVWNNKTRQLDGVPTVFIDTFPVSDAESEKYSLIQLICRKALQKPKQCST